ncbi:MAG: CPBP family intramembrane metalloprotease [Candidatus Aminicenantes bacterium]|nr:CPBP family intramembrane metalloprotease [Candidatus Aminicenantes bacterium]
MEEKTDIVKRLVTFVAFTFGISSVFMGWAISSGSMGAGGGLAAMGGMWSPGIAAILTQLSYRKSLRGFGWGWGKTKYQVWSYVIPILYVGTVHGIVWISGLGGFNGEPLTSGLGNTLKNIAVTTVFGSLFALGEEIGWSGFFVPQLAKITGFAKTSLARGIVWSVWHYPLIIGGVYGPDNVPVWYKLVFFTITMTCVSFAFTWMRLKSGSLYTGMFMHASHNLFFQGVFDRLTTETDKTWYFVDEFGAISAAVAIVVALIFWSKRRQL